MVDLAATCEGAGHCRCGGRSQPAQLRATPFHPSTQPIALLSFARGAGPSRCGRRWRDALFEGPFGRSPGRTKLRSQAATGPCGFTHRRSRRRPSSPSVPLPRAQGLTRLIHPFWCARWASKGDQQPLRPFSCGAKHRQGHAVSPSLEQAVHRVTSSPYLHASPSRPGPPSHRPRHFPRSAGRLSGGCRCLWADRPGPASS